jgi:hypothetical protein
MREPHSNAQSAIEWGGGAFVILLYFFLAGKSGTAAFDGAIVSTGASFAFPTRAEAEPNSARTASS